MEGLSKGMLDGDEEDFGSLLSSTANSSVASSASTSKRVDQGPDQVKIQCLLCYKTWRIKEEN